MEKNKNSYRVNLPDFPALFPNYYENYGELDKNYFNQRTNLTKFASGNHTPVVNDRIEISRRIIIVYGQTRKMLKKK